MPNHAPTKLHDIPWRADLAGDAASIQFELERLWVELSGLLGRVDKAAQTFVRTMRGTVDDQDEWVALGRRSGLAGVDNTLVDFAARISRARDELAEVLEFEVVR